MLVDDGNGPISKLSAAFDQMIGELMRTQASFYTKRNKIAAAYDLLALTCDLKPLEMEEQSRNPGSNASPNLSSHDQHPYEASEANLDSTQETQPYSY